jgi:GNAT superfamily N-acetyltransferase
MDGYVAAKTGVHVDDVVIRPATRADLEPIGMLWEKLVAYHRELDLRLPVAAVDGAERYTNRISDRLDDSYTRVLVAQLPGDDGQVVGFALGVIVELVPEMFVKESGGFLADIFVEAEYRRRGTGRQLVEMLADWFRSRGVEYMEWYVAAQNTTGRAFWEMMGGHDVMVRMRIDL